MQEIMARCTSTPENRPSHNSEKICPKLQESTHEDKENVINKVDLYIHDTNEKKLYAI